MSNATAKVQVTSATPKRQEQYSDPSCKASAVGEGSVQQHEGRTNQDNEADIEVPPRADIASGDDDRGKGSARTEYRPGLDIRNAVHIIEKPEQDGDAHSVVSEASTIMSKSKKTLRREQQRQKQTTFGVKQEMLPNRKDVEVQCDILSWERILNLERKLANSKLKILAVKGNLAEARRNAGLCSGSSGDSSDDPNSDIISRSDANEENIHSEDHEDKCGEMSDDSVQESSLDDTIEVGDVAMITSLASEKGKKLNGRYGKVVSYSPSSSRFGIQLKDGSNFAIRAENLEMGMKSDELSSEDEQILLDLQPTSAEVRMLPWQERMETLRTEGSTSIQRTSTETD